MTLLMENEKRSSRAKAMDGVVADFDVQLRTQTEETVRKFWRASQDPVVREYLPLENQDLSDAVLEWEKRCANPENGFGRAIFVNNTYAGDAWCFRDREENDLVFMNIAIVATQLWGKGIGTLALRRFCDQVVESMPTATFAAFTYADNLASIRSFEKNGFEKREEIFEEGRKSWMLSRPAILS